MELHSTGTVHPGVRLKADINQLQIFTLEALLVVELCCCRKQPQESCTFAVGTDGVPYKPFAIGNHGFQACT